MRFGCAVYDDSGLKRKSAICSCFRRWKGFLIARWDAVRIRLWSGVMFDCQWRTTDENSQLEDARLFVCLSHRVVSLRKTSLTFGVLLLWSQSNNGRYTYIRIGRIYLFDNFIVDSTFLLHWKSCEIYRKRRKVHFQQHHLFCRGKISTWTVYVLQVSRIAKVVLCLSVSVFVSLSLSKCGDRGDSKVLELWLFVLVPSEIRQNHWLTKKKTKTKKKKKTWIWCFSESGIFCLYKTWIWLHPKKRSKTEKRSRKGFRGLLRCVGCN